MSSGLYHINPATGDPGTCSAKMGNCPFGSADEHYTSSEAAREAFETLTSEAAKEASLKAWKRRPKPQSKPAQNTSSGGHGRSSGGHGQSAPVSNSGHGRSGGSRGSSNPVYYDNSSHGTSGHGR